jgi:putative ATP-binding cassette transporter
MTFNPADRPERGSLHGPGNGFLGRFLRFALPFWSAGHKWRNRARAGAIVLLTALQVAVQVGLNFWSARLYNAIEQRALDQFLAQLLTFAGLLAASMAVFACTLRVKRRLQFAWRVWISKTVLEDWMASGRHYQLGMIPGEHDNPDGRIAEDIRIATESALDLAQSLLYCIMLLVTFVGVLWTVSGTLHFSLFGMHVAVPGYLVFIALGYATTGTSLALWVGRPLVSASNLRQTVEADFRFGLVHAREYAEAIALIGGDADERARLLDLLRDVRLGWDVQTAGLTRIILFTSAYSVLASPFPLLVSAPRYILGFITLGTLMQTAQAFQQVTASLSWPVDNLAIITQWRASVERVLALRESLGRLDAMLAGAGQGHIARRREGKALRFEALRITRPDGAGIMRALTAEVGDGAHVRIEGAPAVSRKLMLAIAGLWPWGEGAVCLPEQAQLFFLTDRPYLPIGSLAGAICYPAELGICPAAEIAVALGRVGLAELAGRLGEHDNWEQALSLSQQQRLGFARLLVHRPNWIFLAEATNALDLASQHDMAELLRTEFPGAAVLAIGADGLFDHFFQRTLRVEPEK